MLLSRHKMLFALLKCVLLSCDCLCFVSLFGGAIDGSVVSDCGMFWSDRSYPLVFFISRRGPCYNDSALMVRIFLTDMYIIIINEGDSGLSLSILISASISFFAVATL